MVVMRTPTPSRRQKVIRKLNDIVIARLTTNRRPNILSDNWRFDTSADWKMLGEEFKTWPADPLPDTILITVGIHVTNLGYLEDRPPHFTELLDGSTKESNKMLVRLDIAAIIPETDNQDLLDLIDLEAEWVNKKKEKAERRQQRKINLAQATATGGALSSPNASARRPPLFPVASAGAAGSASAGGDPSSPVADDVPLSAVCGRLLSLVAGVGPLSAVLGRLLSFVAGVGLSSAVLVRPSFPVAGSSSSSAVSGRPLSLVTSGGLLSAVSGCLLFLVPPAGSQALFLTNNLSRTRCSSLPSSPLFHSFLPFSPTRLACNPAPLTRKRSFNQVFITQRPIASKQ